MNKWTYKYNLEHDLPYSKTFIGGRTSSWCGVHKIHTFAHFHTRAHMHDQATATTMIHTFAHTGTHRAHTLTRVLARTSHCFWSPPFFAPSLSHWHTCTENSRVCLCVFARVYACADLARSGSVCALPISRTMLMYSFQMDDDGRRRWWQQDGLQLIALPTFMYFYVIKLLDSHTYNSVAQRSRESCTTRRLQLENE